MEKLKQNAEQHRVREGSPVGVRSEGEDLWWEGLYVKSKSRQMCLTAPAAIAGILARWSCLNTMGTEVTTTHVVHTSHWSYSTHTSSAANTMTHSNSVPTLCDNVTAIQDCSETALFTA